MITLNNVNKTYTSKSQQKVDALRGVSFQLDNTGMVFILGKSGSGKSTLLNLLGGLDSPTGGEIVVDGVNMKDFKQTDYDNYRNGYVGFVFQEFNLLSDFNVKDNIALSLQLSRGNDVDNKVREALHQVELTDDYLTRQISEMSGGEKQRIAIARSIVKDSKMILADEPTGNLDTATGESIWKILKKLSQTQLVVVVSHDRESAEKYADRVIEIADGRVVADNGAQNISDSVVQTFEPQRRHLPLRVSLKMGVNSMLKRKAKAVCIMILSLFCLVMLLFCQMFVFFTPEKTMERFIRLNDVSYFTVKQQYINDEQHELDAFLKADTLNYISQNSAYIVDAVVENKQQLLDFGFTFVGNALELNDNSYYVTKYYLENFGYRNYGYYLEDGKEISLDKSLSVDFLVGKQVYLDGLMRVDGNAGVPTLAGVIDTDNISVPACNLLPPCFTTDTFQNRIYSSSYTVNTGRDNSVGLQFGERRYSERLTVTSGVLQTSGLRGGGIITSDSQVGEPLKQSSELTLADDEVILTYELFSMLFSTNSKNTYTDFEQVTQIPEQLGKTFSLKLCDPTSNELLVDLGEYKLAGVSFDYFDAKDIDGPKYNHKIGLGAQAMIRISRFLEKDREILIKTSSVKDVSRFMTKLRHNYTCYVAHAGFVLPESNQDLYAADCSNIAYGFEDDTDIFVVIFGSIGGVLLVIYVLMVINLISFSITDRKREIGILSALGTSNSDIVMIFVFETLLISVITFALSLGIVILLANLFNALVCVDITIIVPILLIDFVSVTLLVAIAFAVPLVAALLPLRKVAHLKPIDAIRNT